MPLLPVYQNLERQNTTEATGGTKGQKKPQVPYKCVPKTQEIFLGYIVLIIHFLLQNNPPWTLYPGHCEMLGTNLEGHLVSMGFFGTAPCHHHHPLKDSSLHVFYSYVWEPQAKQQEVSGLSRATCTIVQNFVDKEVLGTQWKVSS